jgi:hypothetical protein
MKVYDIFYRKTGCDIKLCPLPVVVSSNEVIDEMVGYMVTYGSSEKMNKPNDRFVLADSGGYLLYTGTAKESVIFSPLEVLLWQKEFADVGIILDLPPIFPQLDAFEVEEKGSAIWKRCKDFTLQSIEVMLKNKGDYPLLLVVHYSDWDGFMEWWNELIEPYLVNFDGVAVPMLTKRVKSDVVKFPLFNYKFLVMCFLISKRIDYVHFLGELSPVMWLFFIYGTKYINFITGDGSSFKRLEAYKRFVDFDLNITFVVGRKRQDAFRTYCSCVYCKDYRKGLIHGRRWLIGHNFVNFWNYVYKWYMLFVEDEEYFKRKLANYLGDVTYKILELFDIAYQGDIDYVKKKLEVLKIDFKRI